MGETATHSDRAGDDRDDAAGDRDARAVDQDVESDARDGRADARDSRSASREQAAGGVDVAAAADRKAAQRDRRSGSGDRVQARADRAAAAADRQLSAVERASEQRLAAAEQRQRLILANLPGTVIALYDRDLRVLRTDGLDSIPSAHTELSVLGAHLSEFFAPDAFDSVKPHVLAALDGQTTRFEHIADDGRVFAVDAAPFRDEQDSITGALTVWRDVTTQAREHQARVDAEHQLRHAFEEAPIGMALVGLDGAFERVNRALCDITGYCDAELAAQAPFAFIHPEDLDAVRSAFASVTASAPRLEIEHRIVTAAGAVRWTLANVTLMFDTLGRPQNVLAQVQDVTERQEREAELERDRRDLNAAQAIAALGSWDYDERANPTTRWSPQLWTIVGLEPRQAGPGIDEFMSMVRTADRQRVVEAMRDARGSGQPWDTEFGIVAADGRQLIVSLHAEPTRDDDGRVVGSFGTIQDITDRAQRDAEERALRRIAEHVAQNAGSAAVFAAVAAEVQRLFDAHSGVLARYDPTTGVGTVLSGHRADGEAMAPLTFDRDGNTPAAAVVRTGRAARVDIGAPFEAAGRTDEWIAENHITGAVVAPITVAGQLWGTLAVAFSGVAIPADAEQRLARFARLTSMAIANADAWDTLSRQASSDAITGLANHRCFQDRLRAEVARARRYRRHLSLVLLDLDHFKRVNDTYGHQAGDRVLAEVGRRLSNAARDGELVARIGGEEFAWLMPETDRDGAFRAAERIRRIVEAEPFPDVGTITVSAGVCASERGLDADDLVRFADRALYWAKDGGRNTTFLYTDEAHALLSERTRKVERFQTMSSVRGLARAIDSKDAATSKHSERVAEIAERLALHLGWTAKRARLLHACGLLHDVGKIGIPDEILLKPARLTPAEYEQIKHHALLGAHIVAVVLEAEQVGWVRGHHERWDGNGYPDALAGDDIPDGAQILAVADAYDVMTESRTYQPRASTADALAECHAHAGTQFASHVIDALSAMTEPDQRPSSSSVPRT